MSDEWLRAKQVAGIWPVTRWSVRKYAELYRVRHVDRPRGPSGRTPERLYLASDVERAYREMTGQAE